MTKQDMDGLWKLLGIYRAGDKHLEDKTLKAAWYLVLKPYEPADVKQAVADYFRACKYWPDVTDISTRCPKPAADKQEASAGREGTGYTDDGLEALRARWMELRDRRTSLGIPDTLSRARALGMSVQSWLNAMEQAGVVL